MLLEALEALFDPALLERDFGHARGRRPVTQPREHPVDLRAGALDHRLDAAVLEIRDPAAQLQRMRLAHRRVTETDALHDAAHPHVVGLDPFVQFIAAHRVALPSCIPFKPGIVVASAASHTGRRVWRARASLPGPAPSRGTTVASARHRKPQLAQPAAAGPPAFSPAPGAAATRARIGCSPVPASPSTALASPCAPTTYNLADAQPPRRARH